MYRIQGIINAFPKAAAQTTGVREIGQLVHLNAAGDANMTTSLIHFPVATERFDATVDAAAALQVTGIAMAYVETFTSIVPGSPVNAGATGLGIKLAAATQPFIGHALRPATVNGQLIPILLGKGHVPA